MRLLTAPCRGRRYRAFVEPEVPLSGGNVSDGIVRVGRTVRRPPSAASSAVHLFLAHLNEVGYDGAPRTYGFDDKGRHVLEYVEGHILMPFEPQDPHSGLRRVGRLLREFHDAASTFIPPVDAQWNVVIPPDRCELVVHHDAAPWNLVLGADRWVFIDWDNAGPGSRLWDLAYAAHGFVPLAPEMSTREAGERLTALTDGYRLDEQGRHELVDLLVPRILSMYSLLERGSREGQQPWSRLWDEGHGDVWRSHAEYAALHLSELTAAMLNAS
jgi:hypothetical protein